MKRLLIGLFVCLLIFSSAACSSETEGSGEEAESSTVSEPVVLSLNHVTAVDHPHQAGALKFAELIEEKTGGAIKVDVFPASQIASGTKAIEFVQMGTLDIALESTMTLSNFVPEIGALDMPFLFESKDHAFSVVDGEVGKELEAIAEEKGFKILSWWDNGFRNVSNSVRPITKPEDLQGIKIRVPQSKIFLATFEALGAIPTPMPLSEVFTAIQLGTVDGQENPHQNFIKNKFYEVCDYYSVTQHMFTANPLIMSTEKFYSFSEEHQAALLEAAKEAAIFQREITAKQDEVDMETIRETGVNVNIVEDMSEFQAAVQPIYDQFEGEFGYFIDKIKALVD